MKTIGHIFDLQSLTVNSHAGSRHHWYYAVCPKHGKQPHLTVLDGKCQKCANEEEEEERQRPKTRT